MEHLLAVAAVLAVATFATGLLLPLTAPRRRDRDAEEEREATLRAELAVWS